MSEKGFRRERGSKEEDVKTSEPKLFNWKKKDGQWARQSEKLNRTQRVGGKQKEHASLPADAPEA